MPASCLDLELTESALIEAQEPTPRLFSALRAMGVRLILDDYGTGFSSLSYFTTFRFDGIKVDASLIRDIETQPDRQAVVRAVTQLASDFAMSVTAEGVETRTQSEWLKQNGVDTVQSFLFSRPLAEDVALEILRGAPTPEAAASPASTKA